MPESGLQAFIDNGGRLERPPNCSQEIVDILYACWNSNPKLRPVSDLVAWRYIVYHDRTSRRCHGR